MPANYGIENSPAFGAGGRGGAKITAVAAIEPRYRRGKILEPHEHHENGDRHDARQSAAVEPHDHQDGGGVEG